MTRHIENGSTPEPFLPGTVIELADLSELIAFEDELVPYVDPTYNPGAWEARPHIRDFIMPLNFNGSIANIRLEVMDEPYERLLDANDRGWVFSKRYGNLKLTSEFAEELIPRYKAFVLTAEAISSGRGVIGQIQAELWYYPLTLTRSEQTLHRGQKRISSYRDKTGRKITYESVRSMEDKTFSRIVKKGGDKGLAINRIVTKPKIEKENFINFNNASRHIGLTLLRQNLAHPITTPMLE